MSKGGVGRLLRQLNVDDWVGREIDRYFDTKASPEGWQKAGPAIRPSGAGSPCAREIELGMLGHRPAYPGQSRRRMDNGSDMHKRWQRYFSEARLLAAAELPVRLNDPVVSGRLDVVLKNPVTGKLALGEIKSVNSQGFRQLPKLIADKHLNAQRLAAWNPPWGRGYMLQFCWYSEHGELHGSRFDEGFFLFENKDTQDYKVFYVTPTPELVKESQTRPLAAQQAFRSGVLLDRPFERNSPTCRRCEKAMICDLLEDGDAATWAIVMRQFESAGIMGREKGKSKSKRGG